MHLRTFLPSITKLRPKCFYSMIVFGGGVLSGLICRCVVFGCEIIKKRKEKKNKNNCCNFMKLLPTLQSWDPLTRKHTKHSFKKIKVLISDPRYEENISLLKLIDKY